MNCIGTYDGTIFYNPANKFCIISVKTADQSVPAEARSNRRYKDHLIRFTAVGYEIPRTDAVELELDGEWAKGKYGVQLQVEQWREIVPRTKNGVEGYLASGLIKGIGPKTAADIVERFGVDTLDILEHQPERLLEIRGITENKLEDIKASYAENRMLQGIMTLLAPFKITPKTALKIYQYFGPTSVEILEKSPFELCQISGFGFRRVDAIVQKSGGDLHDPMRIKGAVFCALDEGKSKRGHLYISSEELEKSALKLLNEKIPVPELRLHQQEVRDMMQEMILNGAIVSVKDADDCMIFCKSKRSAERTLKNIIPFIEGKLFLKVNRKKTEVAHISKVKYLGYTFYRYKGKCRFRVHQKSAVKMRNKIRELTDRNKGISNAERERKYREYVRGWVEYFRLADMKGLLKTTDEWARRRIRAVYWKQWKRVRTRYRILRKLKLEHWQAIKLANSR